MRRWALLLSAATALAVALLAGPAAAAPAPAAGKAQAAAAKRLFAYVYPMSYVVDYALTGCTREGVRLVCTYKIGFYAGETCTGTISVDPSAHGLTTRVVTPCVTGTTVAPTPPATPTGGSTGGTAGGTTVNPTAPVTPTTPSGSTPAPVTPPLVTPAAPTPSAGPYKGLDSLHDVRSVTADGATVVLTDGSRWQIDAANRSITASWRAGDSIAVLQGGEPTYLLVDVDASGGAPAAATYLGTS